MAESKSESETSRLTHLNLVQIFDLFDSAGYVDANRNELSDFDKLFGGLSWCISVCSDDTFNPPRKIATVQDIVDALKSMGCTHALQANQIEDLDCVAVYPAVHWLVSLVNTKQHKNGHVNRRKAAVLNELQLLRERIDEAGIDSTVQNLASLLKKSKALEMQESNFQSECNKQHWRLMAEIARLERKLSDGTDDKDLCDHLDHSICDLTMILKHAKRAYSIYRWKKEKFNKDTSCEEFVLVLVVLDHWINEWKQDSEIELGSKLRESVYLKRQLDDVPIAEEIAQYEHRFSELNLHIQDRLRRTRRYYATYNTLLEIKDLMLKEISLLNSLDSQFQDAFGNAGCRKKLIDSMEAIFRGTQQKLEKVQPGLQAERKTFDALREQYTAAIANKRRAGALLKAFQEECKKNEKLKEECAKNGSSSGHSLS